MTLYIFNPEHDLCLANGDPNYVPPASALAFARTGLSAMKTIYGDDAEVIPAEDFAKWLENNTQTFKHSNIQTINIVPWGWDSRLKRTLIKQGCPEEILPTDVWLETLRQLQHRSTIAEIQPHATCAYSLSAIDSQLHSNTQAFKHSDIQSIVLKAPWSGAGRGIRFVDGSLTEHDRHWAKKVIAEQRCVIVERRLQIKEEYALEYMISDEEVQQSSIHTIKQPDNQAIILTGLSLFVTQSGVYRHNILLSDDEIRSRVCLPKQVEEDVFNWLSANVVGRYEGPLGVDLILDQRGNTYVSEINFRHTMGMVAHASINKRNKPTTQQIKRY